MSRACAAVDARALPDEQNGRAGDGRECHPELAAVARPPSRGRHGRADRGCSLNLFSPPKHSPHLACLPSLPNSQPALTLSYIPTQIANPPGYSACALSSVGRVQVLLDPWSVFAPSALVQSIHMEDIVVHLERHNGVNNTRALRMLMDVRKRARRAGEPVPLLGYPSAVTSRLSSSARASSGASQAEDAIISSTSESDDSDTSVEDLDEDACHGRGHGNLRSLVAETASEAASWACAAASNALTRSRKSNAQTSAAKAKSAARGLLKRGQALKTALAKRVSTRRRAPRAEQELSLDADDTRDRSESLASLVEVETDEEGNAVTEEEDTEERELVDVWEDAGEDEDNGLSSRQSPLAPDGYGDGAGGSGQESPDAAAHAAASGAMSAEELHQELAKIGTNLQEKDLKMYEDMWHDRLCEDLSAVALAAMHPPDALSGAGPSGALGRVEELKTSAASMKRRLVGSAVNSGLKVSSIMGDKVKSVMGAGDKFGSALGLRRRREGAGGGGQDGPVEQQRSDRRASDAEDECQEKENVAAAEEEGMGGQVTAGGIGGAKKAVLGTLKAGASTLGWSVSKAKVLIRAGSGGSEFSEAADVHATGGQETGAQDAACGGGGGSGGGGGAAARVADDRVGIPAEEVEAAVSPGAQYNEGGWGEGERPRDTAEDAGRSNEADAAPEAARPEGMTIKFKRLAAGGSRRVLGLVRGDEPGAAASLGADTREMTHELPGLMRECVGIVKSDNPAAGKGAASRVSARSERGEQKASSEEATRSCEHERRPVSGEGMGGAILEKVRSAGGRVGGSSSEHPLEQPSRYQALRSRAKAIRVSSNAPALPARAQTGAGALIGRLDPRGWSWSGLLQPVVRELDRKLVVIDLVTIHRVHIHVDWVVRALQGNLPPETRETGRLQGDAGSESRGVQKLVYTSDEGSEAGAAQGPSSRLFDGERGGEGEKGDKQKVAVEGDVEAMCGKREDAGQSDDKAVPPLFLEAIRMTADDFRPDPTLHPAPLGIPPSEAVSSLRCPVRRMQDQRHAQSSCLCRCDCGMYSSIARAPRCLNTGWETRAREHRGAPSARACVSRSCAELSRLRGLAPKSKERFGAPIARASYRSAATWRWAGFGGNLCFSFDAAARPCPRRHGDAPPRGCAGYGHPLLIFCRLQESRQLAQRGSVVLYAG
jgi:hypothetical protein